MKFNKWSKFYVIIVCVLIGCNIVSAQEFSCSFGKDQWQSNKWIHVKSPRWDYQGKWIQKDNHIENQVPDGATPKDLLGKVAGQTYTSMVLKEKFKGNVTISSNMEFTDRMAPLIVIAPELGENTNGIPEYREHFEIVLFDKGFNVWHHIFKNGKPSWKKAAYSNFTLKPNTRYTLQVKLTGKMMTIAVDGHEMGYLNASLPNEFHIGITGCEGVNRFYDLSVNKTTK